MIGAETWVRDLVDGVPQEQMPSQMQRLTTLHSGMEAYLFSYIEAMIKLQPADQAAIIGEHRAFVRVLKSRLDIALSSLIQKQVAAPVPHIQATPATTRASPSAAPKLQLEKLKVPTFDGDHTKWLNFKAWFKEIVAVGANYDDVAQGHILKDVIPKEAGEQVEHLSSAKEMFDILGKVYGNEDVCEPYC